MVMKIKKGDDGRQMVEKVVQKEIDQEVESAKEKGENMSYTEQGAARMRKIQSMFYGNHDDRD